ncbi:MAG: 50S ribosomal protein L21 [Chloroflexi bacterium]|nr:50S ribosomal protein L21 [Chloroflexota bacterium]
MYAVIETGGKQYRVELGSEIEVDRMDVEPGQTIDLDRVLLVADGDDAAVGRPVVEGASVSASVVRQTRGDKVVVFKYKPKARTRVKQGHRADLTVLRIADIAWAGRSAASEQAKVDKERAKQAAAAEKAAAEQAAADEALAKQLAAASAAAADAETDAAEPAKPRRTRKAAAEAATPAETTTDESADADAVASAADETPAADGSAALTQDAPAAADAEPADEPRKDG